MHVETVATAAQKPSNVAAYVSVADGDRPITNLDEFSFKIYEDGKLLDHAQIQQRLLPSDQVAAHRTLLLVDMSGDIKDSFTRDHIAQAVSGFVSAVRATQPVTVYAFDGAKTIRFIGDYPMGEDPVSEITPLVKYTSKDVSSNLNAAVVDALKQLDARLASSGRSLRVGTLVVFARGSDLAGRVSGSEMDSAIEDSGHHVMGIGIKSAGYRPGFASETFMAEDMYGLGATFITAAQRVTDLAKQFYLIAYCSPSRAGDRSARIEVTTKNAEGEEISGAAYVEFNADGFGSGCDSKTTPRFVTPKRGHGSESHAGSGNSTSGAATPKENDDEAVVPPPNKPGYAP